jgi:hypothetical protein
VALTFAVHDVRLSHNDPSPDENGALPAQPPGTWRVEYAKGKPGAVVTCPMCGARCGVAPERIAASGAVDGALFCSSCTWFEYVTLDGFASATGQS